MKRTKLKISLILTALASGQSFAAPQENPDQCQYPLSSLSQKQQIAMMQQGIESCLLAVGNQNFKRQGKQLIIPLAKGKVTYLNKPSEYDTHRTYQYGGYDKKNGFHLVDGSGGEWHWHELISHTTGYRYTLDGVLIAGGVSPGANLAFFTSGEMSCGNEVYVGKLTTEKKQGVLKEVENLTPQVSVCQDELVSVPASIEWVSHRRVRIQWHCQLNFEEQGQDETLIVNQNGHWQADRLPCLSNVKAQGQTQLAKHDKAVLSENMSLNEVEALFGGDAEAFVVDPFGLLTESSITRIWSVNGAKLKVKFVDDKVVSWSY
ncbi:hypothetical protein [Motilimonas cestriensis]|uniref:hypothetical protein n=1 Tax=Motilimonas cestriensis TaxID=2742685 RepID=UPI003DA29164